MITLICFLNYYLDLHYVSGVAGVQPKVLLDAKQQFKQQFKQQVNQKNTYPIDSYIVKSWGDEYPQLACNEFICLSMAQVAGLVVSLFILVIMVDY
ncbi:HipA domain-containing protein [Psychromonas sp. KJ10-10]|uniref:HipA domain-containing protein n=1 Tax=Psychromonas sp. KJ10-10 TaxID=3391823 RepID=UPI0039B4F72F